MEQDYGKRVWHRMSDEEQWRAIADFLTNYFNIQTKLARKRIR